MYRYLFYIVFLLFSSVSVLQAEDEAYCSKSKECMEGRWLELKEAIFENKELKNGEGVIELSTPKRAPDGAFVPISFKTQKLKNNSISKVHLIIDMNPSPYSGAFKFSTT